MTPLPDNEIKSTTPRTDSAIKVYPAHGSGLIAFGDIEVSRQLETELSVSQARVRELEKDKERLNWLDNHCFDSHFLTAQEYTYLASVLFHRGVPKTSRHAIDEAMIYSKPPTPQPVSDEP